MSSDSLTLSTVKEERVSWRVPNETKNQDVSLDNHSSSKKESRSGVRGTPVSGDRFIAKSDSGPNSPAEGRKGSKLVNKGLTGPSLEEPKNKLWRILFANVIRSFDEIYEHCEEQGEISKCFEVADLLKRSRVDFTKLAETIDEQARFQLGQAMSWETRKPTLPSPINPASAGSTTGGRCTPLLDIDTSPPPGTGTPVAANSPIAERGGEVSRAGAIEGAATSMPAAVANSSSVSPKYGGYDVPVSVVMSSPPPSLLKGRLNPAAKPYVPAFAVHNTTPTAAVASAADTVVIVPSISSTTNVSAKEASEAGSKAQVPPVVRVGAPGLNKISPARVPIAHTPVVTTPAPVVSRKKSAASMSAHVVMPPSRSHNHSNNINNSSKAARVDEEQLHAEMLQATEHVWAAAEAWVEAEAEAEEQEWQLLALGINSFLKDSNAEETLSDYEEDPPRGYDTGLPVGLRTGGLSAHNSPKQFPGIGLGMGFPTNAAANIESARAASTGGIMAGASHWEGNFIALSPAQRAIWEHSPPSKQLTAQQNAAGARTGAGSKAAAAGALHICTPTSPSVKRMEAHTPPQRQTSEVEGRGGRTSDAALSPPDNYSSSLVESGDGGEKLLNSHRSPSVSPSDSFFSSSVAGAACGGGAGASGGRSLHDKLSSPDRKRTISPTEALRRYEERQINAEMNRDKTVAERIQKANVASQRLKLLEQKEAQRRIDVLQAIQSKMRDAEERKNQYLKQIQVRAFHESSKVNEVIYVNALNSEAIAQRLEEVETRIFAASERRQERLHGMTLDQRRRNSRKAQHLSEWRLQFEKEKLERWEKLQQRIASVNARRTARLAELQRRADEESRRVLGTSLANSGTLLLPAHDGAASADATAAGGRAASSDKNTVGSAIVAHAQTAALKAPPITSKSKAAVRKLAVSGNLSGKRSGRSVISQPPPLPPTPTRTPTPGASPSGPQTNDTTENGDATGTAVAAAERDVDAPAKPSKSKGKREKRKLKAQLIEMAEKADIAVIQAAIAMNNGTSDDVAATAGGGDAALDVEVASNKTATIPTAAENSSDHANTYAHAQHLVRHCPGDCVSEGFAAWSKLAAKRVNVVARADHANDCEADARMSAVNPAVSSDPATEAIEELPAAEQLLVQKMRSTSAGDLLACVVNDLLAVAQKPPSEDAPVSMQVMQRLYVLLQHAALGAGGERPSPDPAVAVDVPVPGLSEVLLLRMLFGSEVGVLRSAAQLQTLLDALVFYQHQHVLRNTTTSSGTTAPTSATTTAPSSTAVASTPKSAGAVSAVSQELEVQAEVWKLLVDLLLQCSASAPGAALIVQSGLGAVLVDILQALLLTMEAYRKSDSSTTHAHSSLLASALDLPAVPVCAQFAFDGCFPTAVTSVASAVMTVLARVLSCVPAEGNGPSVGAVSCSQASLDSLAWYLFTMGQVQLLADNLRIRSQHWHYTQSYHYRAALPTQTITGSIDCVACSTDFYLAASDYLGSIGLFIRMSGGLLLCEWHRRPWWPTAQQDRQSTSDTSGDAGVGVGVVESILQLSPASHRHSKGRQLVSILRRADSLLALLETLAIATSRDYFSHPKMHSSYVDNLVLLGRLSDAICSMLSADISLVNAINSPDLQVLWVRTVSNVIGTLQRALDGPHQSFFPGQYTGSKSSLCASKIVLSRASLEDSLRILFVTVALSCLRNPALQKTCGTALPLSSDSAISTVGAAARAGGTAPTSLLVTLCSLTPKYYKDKKFKHSLLPCLIAMCADCDANTFQLGRLGKLIVIAKYLENSVRAGEILASHTSQQQQQQQQLNSTSAGGPPVSAASTAAPVEPPLPAAAAAAAVLGRAEEAQHVRRLSNIIPKELWHVNLVTLSRN